MICLHCDKLNLRDFPKHAAVGFGRCTLDQMPGVFVSITYDRKCARYKEAPAEVKAKRIEWHEKLFNQERGK